MTREKEEREGEREGGRGTKRVGEGGRRKRSQLEDRESGKEGTREKKVKVMNYRWLECSHGFPRLPGLSFQSGGYCSYRKQKGAWLLKLQHVEWLGH